MKEAQVSSEYLVLIAIALLIGLVLIAVFGGLPRLAASQSPIQIEAYWATAKPFAIVSWQFHKDNQGQITVRNNDYRLVRINEVTLQQGNNTCNITRSERGEELTGWYKPGAEKTFFGVINCSEKNACNEDSEYAFNVSIHYEAKNDGGVQIGAAEIIGKCLEEQ